MRDRSIGRLDVPLGIPPRLTHWTAMGHSALQATRSLATFHRLSQRWTQCRLLVVVLRGRPQGHSYSFNKKFDISQTIQSSPLSSGVWPQSVYRRPGSGQCELEWSRAYLDGRRHAPRMADWPQIMESNIARHLSTGNNSLFHWTIRWWFTTQNYFIGMFSDS